MKISQWHVYVWLILGAAPALPTRVQAAEIAPSQSARAAEILKSAIAVYRNPNLMYSGQVLRRTLSLKVQAGDGSSPNDYITDDVGYLSATLRVRAPYAVFWDAKRYTQSSGSGRSFVAAKFGRNRGRFAIAGTDKDRVPPPENDEAFESHWRTAYGLNPDFVVESLIFGPGDGDGALALDYATAETKGEGAFLDEPVYQVEVRSVKGSCLRLWIAKSDFLILHTMVIPAGGEREVIETIYRDSSLNGNLAGGDFAFRVPEGSLGFDPDSLGLGNTDGSIAFMAGHTIPAAAGVVAIVGDRSTATGFYALVHNVPCVVTNLRVLAENENYTVRRAQGDGTIPVQGVIAAVGSDVALLRVGQFEPSAKPLRLATDVVKEARVSDQTLLIGSRATGGFGAKSGSVTAIVGGRVDVLTEFEPGNSGSPVIDSVAGVVLGVATFSETHGLEQRSTTTLDSLVPRILFGEKRWYVSRLDTIAKWEAVDAVQWRRQVRQVDEFRKDSLALLEMLKGQMGTTARSQPGIAKFLNRFLLNLDRPSSLTPPAMETRFEGASVTAVQRLLHDALEYAESTSHDLATGTFYDYFHSSLFWENSIEEQIKYRKLIIGAIISIQADLNLQDQLFRAYNHVIP